MIDHLFIKNYKVFERENIPLDKNTLFIGTNASGKTTILEALDLFFNNVFHYEYVRDIEEDIVIEIHINDERYRKVYKSPNYRIEYSKCIGNMYDINHIKYLYVPKYIYAPKLLNDILSINLSVDTKNIDQTKVFKVFDYLDGKLGNNTYNFFSINTKYEMNINDDITFTRDEYTRIISNITHQYTIIGIDNFEDNFDLKALTDICEYSYQTIFTSKHKDVVTNFNYSIKALYKDDIKQELDTITKVFSKNHKKKLLLVEGKYDVAWFEKGLSLLDEFSNYRVIPCGGYGNIQYVRTQLEKEGYTTITIVDGDVSSDDSLKREVIELYADIDYINKRFNMSFKNMPRRKKEFFKKFHVKDDVVKKVLSSWAKKNLSLDSVFVQELDMLIG